MIWRRTILLICSIASSVLPDVAASKAPSSDYYDYEYRAQRAYDTGQFAEARSLYAKGCALGGMVSCFALGSLLETDQGGPADLPRARLIHTKGCKLGNPLSCTELGLMFEGGAGGPQNLARARLYYGEACDLDLSDGCILLAEM